MGNGIFGAWYDLLIQSHGITMSVERRYPFPPFPFSQCV